MKLFDNAIFIFRRDLRLEDNRGLREAYQKSNLIIPLFILDPRQISAKNTYKSDCAIQFMAESLIDLDANIKKGNGRLYIIRMEAEKAVEYLCKQLKPQAIFFNKDYTPFSKKRDTAIEMVCKQYGIPSFIIDDALLTEPESVKTKSGRYYTKFTPFFKNASQMPVSQPQAAPRIRWFTGTIAKTDAIEIMQQYIGKKNYYTTGGRKKGLKIIQSLSSFKDYTKKRDIPFLDHTTHLSAHNKFGTVSIREVYHAIKNTLGKNHGLITQLYWRDFFTHIAWHHPSVFGSAFQKKYNTISWSYNKKHFESWYTGNTGFPIVDAGMRQLNKTGFMHNRVRMIVASFLTKDLHIDWQWGERYFAQKLIDYDPCVNNGNWQWAASTGCDAQPYFRIFNPWLQQKKFDPQALYIKQWVPELKQYSAEIIHALYKKPLPISIYPKSIVSHETQAKITKVLFKKILPKSS